MDAFELVKPRLQNKTGKSRLKWLALVLLVCMAVAGAAIIWALRHAEPILQARIIETLSARFQSRVELSSFHVSISRGLRVWGGELKIFGKTDVNIHQPGLQPIIAVDEFQFGAGILDLLRTPMRVHRVYLKGLQLNIPPKGQRGESNAQSRNIKIYVDEFDCERAQLVINTLVPGKLPLE